MGWLALSVVLAVANLWSAAAEPRWQPESQASEVSTSAPRQARLARLECVGADGVELEVTSTDPFPVRNALTELHVGSLVSAFSRYPESGDTHTLIFILTRDQLASVATAEPAFVRYNPSNGADIWAMGVIDVDAAVGCERADPAEYPAG